VKHNSKYGKQWINLYQETTNDGMDGLFGSQGESHQTQPPFESSYPSCIIVCLCIKFEVDMDYHLQVFSILRQCIYVLKQI